MYENLPTWILTGALVIVTILVWLATKKVAVATSQVANATKEMSKTTIKPRPTIIYHKQIGEDQEHHHYQFFVKNFGLGDALNVIIETVDKKGSAIQPTIPRLRSNQIITFKATNVERSKDPVTIKIKYNDVMDNPYTEQIDYDIANDVFYLQELRPEKDQ